MYYQKKSALEVLTIEELSEHDASEKDYDYFLLNIATTSEDPDPDMIYIKLKKGIINLDHLRTKKVVKDISSAKTNSKTKFKNGKYIVDVNGLLHNTDNFKTVLPCVFELKAGPGMYIAQLHVNGNDNINVFRSTKEDCLDYIDKMMADIIIPFYNSDFTTYGFRSVYVDTDGVNPIIANLSNRGLSPLRIASDISRRTLAVAILESHLKMSDYVEKLGIASLRSYHPIYKPFSSHNAEEGSTEVTNLYYYEGKYTSEDEELNKYIRYGFILNEIYD